MGDYKGGKNTGGEPGRPIHNTIVNSNVDANAIAQTVINALSGINLGTNQPVRQNTGVEFDDDFDNKNSLEKLADSMVVQRGKGESNFDNLGGTAETKKDAKETDQTIDLLKGLDD